jgi:hypothetical protein
LRQSAFIVQQITMICGAERFLEVRRAVLTNRQQALGKADASFPPHTVQTLANGFGHRSSHTFPSQRREFLNQSMSLVILDVQTHKGTFLPNKINLFGKRLTNGRSNTRLTESEKNTKVASWLLLFPPLELLLL